MSDLAIRVDKLGKEYRIGSTQARYNTLRDTIVETLKAPFRRGVNLLSGQVYGGSDLEHVIWALKDVCFEIQQGEAVGIIGRNGAGKTTLLKILSRITEPTKGAVDLYGRVGSLLEVGTGFHPELTGKENIYLSAAIQGMKRKEIEQKYDEIVEFAEIEKFLDTPVKHYSSGMYVRLAFSVAAHLEPEILLVDEVLAVGDAAFQKKCLGKMGSVAREGRTILFVSHNMAAIQALCQRALWIDNGQIECDSDAVSAVQRYLGSNQTPVNHKSWDMQVRPGNNYFKINYVTLKDRLGNEISEVRISEPVIVEINYEVIQNNAQVGFSLVVYDADGYAAFSSLSNTEKDYYGKMMPLGQYTTRCELYGDLLNTGRYNISIIGFTANWSEGFRIDQVLSLDAVNDGVLSADYYGNYSGTVRPRLSWKTKAIEF